MFEKFFKILKLADVNTSSISVFKELVYLILLQQMQKKKKKKKIVM